MINLTIGTNTERSQKIVEEDSTLMDVILDNGINTGNCIFYLDGSVLCNAELDCTFKELGVESGASAMLMAVIKADSATN